MINKTKIEEAIKEPTTASNNDLITSMDHLKGEFDKTKDLLMKLTDYLDVVEKAYYKVMNEYRKRTNNE